MQMYGFELDSKKLARATFQAMLAQAGLIPNFTRDVPPELTRLFEQVRKTCGMTTRRVGMLGMPSQMPLDLSSGPGPSKEFPGDWVVSNPMVMDFIPNDLLPAIIAHELGHIANDDSAFKRRYI